MATMRVFISYSQDDAETAKQFGEALSAAGYRPFVADEVLSTGSNWSKAIGNALEHSDAIVILISPASMRSRWMQREIEYALSSPRFEDRVFSLLIKPTPQKDVPWILERLSWIDATKDLKAAGNRLVKAMQRTQKAAG